MKFRTQKEIAQRPDPEDRFGEILYAPTNRIRPRAPLAGMSGHVDKKTVYVMGANGTHRRRYVAPVFPNTPKQAEQNAFFTDSQQGWSAVGAEDRAGWQEFAEAHCFHDREARLTSSLGQNAYAQAQRNRLGWGGTMTSAPPTIPPPPAALAVEQVAAPSPEMFAVRIRHDLPSTAGFRVLFEMTPATKTLRRTPHEREFVWAGERREESFLPLGPDGAVYLLEAPRYFVEASRRYGIRIRLITPEGLAGPKTAGDFIREEPAPLPIPPAAPRIDDVLSLEGIAPPRPNASSAIRPPITARGNPPDG